MALSASDVKALREKTGCGMMDCKKALIETGGDMDKAIDYLREKGLAAAAKKSGRVAAEGISYAAANEDHSVGAIVEVNSETDFVAKNSEFVEFVKGCGQTVIDDAPSDLDDFMNSNFCNSGKKTSEILVEKIAKIGENLKIRRFRRFAGFVVPYIHANGRIAVLVNADVPDELRDNSLVVEALKDVAMQIAAINPLYLDKNSVPADVLEKEKKILKEQVVNDGKPEAIAEKIVVGKLGKFYRDSCLLEQIFVKNGDISVLQYMGEIAKKTGSSFKILDFARFETGEGIDKKDSDFAAEVASMVK